MNITLHYTMGSDQERPDGFGPSCTGDVEKLSLLNSHLGNIQLKTTQSVQVTLVGEIETR